METVTTLLRFSRHAQMGGSAKQNSRFAKNFHFAKTRDAASENGIVLTPLRGILTGNGPVTFSLNRSRRQRRNPRLPWRIKIYACADY